MRACVDVRHVPDCRPRHIARLRLKLYGYTRPRPTSSLVMPELPTSRESCGAMGAISVPLRITRKGPRVGRARVVMRAITNQDRKDSDRLYLVCQPGTSRCFSNPTGGPAELDLVTAAAGSDIDLGSTGLAYDLAVPPGARLSLCLTGCDATTQPVCDAVGGYVDQAVGAPVPLLAGGVRPVF